MIGRVLSDTYRIVRKLGEGGMGTVYEATTVRLGKRMAIKVLSRLAMAEDEIVHRFRREAQIATDLGHPHIVDVLDFNRTEDGVHFMVMEYLEGEDLEARLTRRGSLDVEPLVFIARQVCSALHAAHEHGVVHRDLKPANIFLCRKRDYEDFVKVVDFGISKVLGSLSVHTRDDTILGTPHFMSPEQALGDNSQIGPWTDVFSLGSILYRALAGRFPFISDLLPGVLFQIVHRDPPPLASLRPEAPPALVAAVTRAMAKQPQERFADMRAMSAALRDAAQAARSAMDWEESVYEPPSPPRGKLHTPEAVAETLAPRTPPSTLSAAASELGPPARSGRALTIGFTAGVAVLVAGVIAVGLIARGPARPAASPDASPRALATRLAPPAPDAGRPRDAALATVQISVEGAPRGARVIDVNTGATLTTVPGSFRWTRSPERRAVRVVAAGHLPERLEIGPTHDTNVVVKLRRRTGNPDLPTNPHGP